MIYKVDHRVNPDFVGQKYYIRKHQLHHCVINFEDYRYLFTAGNIGQESDVQFKNKQF